MKRMYTMMLAVALSGVVCDAATSPPSPTSPTSPRASIAGRPLWQKVLMNKNTPNVGIAGLAGVVIARLYFEVKYNNLMSEKVALEEKHGFQDDRSLGKLTGKKWSDYQRYIEVIDSMSSNNKIWWMLYGTSIATLGGVYGTYAYQKKNGKI